MEKIWIWRRYLVIQGSLNIFHYLDQKISGGKTDLMLTFPLLMFKKKNAQASELRNKWPAQLYYPDGKKLIRVCAN